MYLSLCFRCESMHRRKAEVSHVTHVKSGRLFNSRPVLCFGCWSGKTHWCFLTSLVCSTIVHTSSVMDRDVCTFWCIIFMSKNECESGFVGLRAFSDIYTLSLQPSLTHKLPLTHMCLTMVLAGAAVQMKSCEMLSNISESRFCPWVLTASTYSHTHTPPKINSQQTQQSTTEF